jgi:hypothetical protein
MRKALGALMIGSVLTMVLAQASCSGGASGTPNCDEYCACNAILKAQCEASKKAGSPLTEAQCKQALSDYKSQYKCDGAADAATGG